MKSLIPFKNWAMNFHWKTSLPRIKQLCQWQSWRTFSTTYHGTHLTPTPSLTRRISLWTSRWKRKWEQALASNLDRRACHKRVLFTKSAWLERTISHRKSSLTKKLTLRIKWTTHRASCKRWSKTRSSRSLPWTLAWSQSHQKVLRQGPQCKVKLYTHSIITSRVQAT